MNSLKTRAIEDRGVAAGEFALVLPILLVLVFGIIDFGLYYYNDLLLTQTARDAARYVSVGDVAEANDVIDNLTASLVSTTFTRSITYPAGVEDQGAEATVALTGTYKTLTPLPQLAGLGETFAINATAKMRRE